MCIKPHNFRERSDLGCFQLDLLLNRYGFWRKVDPGWFPNPTDRNLRARAEPWLVTPANGSEGEERSETKSSISTYRLIISILLFRE